MSQYRIVTENGIHFVAGGIIPAALVKVGQQWVGASGSIVTIEHVTFDNEADAWVRYSWVKNDVTHFHEKLNFAFQCRYCLVVNEPTLPPYLN